MPHTDSDVRRAWMKRALENTNKYTGPSIMSILEVVCPVLDRLERLQQEADKLTTKRDLIEQQYGEELKKLETIKSNFRSSCLHYSTTFHPDASGGNDSFETCDVCGAEM